ncbi:MAG: hypothetical protein F4X34_08975 [Chloroflexi bacterium]|nr:hypothetical protein [Chloroflexota bacterium]
MDTEEVETPKIAEKVRFWEEQDRINQELIPRVIKQHELFTAHIEGHETASTQIAALEGRLNEAIQAAANRSIEAAEAAGQHAIEEADKKIAEAEANSAIAVAAARRQAIWVSGLSLVIAASSFIFALVS